jgi:hypothetical protein
VADEQRDFEETRAVLCDECRSFAVILDGIGVIVTHQAHGGRLEANGMADGNPTMDDLFVAVEVTATGGVVVKD